MWYVVERVLGQGGFGITYLAADTNLDQRVAIKEYLPSQLAVRETDSSVHPASDGDTERYRWGLDRFIQEARTLAKFKHRALVRVLSVFEENKTAYMVMEYERGDSLQSILSKQQTLAEAQLRAIVMPILDGLDVVHGKGFIHRDIKPDNIFIRKDGTPVLLDFGSARQALGQATRTLTSIVSPGYAPFEQYYSKSDKQGPWTDIYGLAATLYRATVGTAPIDALRRSDGILREKHDTLSAAEIEAEGSYSKRFLQAIDYGLKFSEKQRPQTVAQWREEFGSEPAITAPPAPPTPRTFDVVPVESEQVLDSEVLFAPVETPQIPQSAPAQPGFTGGYAEPAQIVRRRRWPVVLLVLAVCTAGGIYFSIQQGWRLEVGGPPRTSRPAGGMKDTRDVARPKSNAIRSLNDDPSTPIDSARRARTVAALLDQAKLAVNRDLIIEPPGESAMSLYEQVLELEPDNDTARAAMRGIVDTLALRAGRAAARNDFVKAEALLNKAAQLEPGSRPVAFAKEQLAKQKAQWESVEAVQTRIRKELEAAEAALAAGRLGSPAGDNASEHFQNVLDLDADSASAHEGLSRIVDMYVAQANVAIDKKDFAAAAVALAGASEIRPEAGNIKRLSERLMQEEGAHQARQTKIRNIESLLNAAEDNLKAMRLSKPAKDSALYRYRQVLKLDPKNREARRGLEIIVVKYLGLAEKARAAGDTNAIAEHVQAAKAILPNAANIKLFERTLAADKVEQAAREEREKAEQAAREEREVEADTRRLLLDAQGR